MRSAAMCFSLSQFPRCSVHTLTNSWRQSFHHSSRIGRGSISSKVIASGKHGLDGKYNSTENRQTLTTKAEGKNKAAFSRKTTIRHEILDETTTSKGDIYNSEVTEIGCTKYVDIRQTIVENKDLAKLMTFIIFDIETTGFSREHERIIEIALRDLHGGENSTFQTLVNPGRSVPNSHIHGITTDMVNRPDVPRILVIRPSKFEVSNKSSVLSLEMYLQNYILTELYKSQDGGPHSHLIAVCGKPPETWWTCGVGGA